MGRIVGDCAIYFFIQDLLVKPQGQGLGIGALIMDSLMLWLEEHAPSRATVGLFAAEGKGPFYEKYGFAARSKAIPAWI